jgi:hypothetical protein
LLSYEREFLASERLRERRVEAEHERLASRARQARRASERGTGARSARVRVAIDFVRRLGRVVQAT